MTPAQHSFIVALMLRMFADRPRQTPADWCCENLVFDEPDNRGPFSLSGREYMREPIDAWADPLITDMDFVFGSQSGKTGGLMGGVAWLSRNEPARVKWVMPTRDLVFSFSRKRWMPMLRRSETFKELIQKGKDRHDFSTLSQIVGGAIIDFGWSNSPAALSSDPCRVVVLDEVDKFDEGGRQEADAVNLAEQRTKSFANPKRAKTSTPTLVTGLIWQDFRKTDQRRRYMPCPFCGKFVVLIWSKNYTVFKCTGEEAEVRWDKEAKRGDDWDLDRVERSARYECPHCGGHIRDGHKTAMDRNGIWRPTANAAKGYRGWHLPSLYAASAECNVGKLAVKFLQAKNSLLGLQGFINGDLAEPYQSQDTRSDRVELVTARVEITNEWKKAMTVDSQAKAPYFWHVVRAWSEKESIGIGAGPLDTWDEIRAMQRREKIPDVGVVVDSGHGAKSDAEVYQNCARHCEILRNENKAYAIGWMPAKGMPGYKRWKDKDSELLLPYFFQHIDPFNGTSQAGQVSMDLFEFSGDFFKDILDNLRKGKGKQKWSVSAEVSKSEEYWTHMDGEVKQAVFNKSTGRTRHLWIARSKHWPNHLFDCEVMQIAVAASLKWMVIE